MVSVGLVSGSALVAASGVVILGAMEPSTGAAVRRYGAADLTIIAVEWNFKGANFFGCWGVWVAWEGTGSCSCMFQASGQLGRAGQREP